MKDDNFDLTPKQIEDLLNDEVDDELQKLLDENPELDAEIEAMKVFNDHLRQAWRGDTDYPTSTEIGEYVLGMLSEDDEKGFEALLAQSPRLQHDVQELRTYLDADVTVPVDTDTSRSKKLVIWAQKLETAEHERVRVAGNDEDNKTLTFEADGHSLLLELQDDYEHNTRLIGQFITEDMAGWVGSQVKVHFRNGSVTEFRLDELNTFDEAWSHPREFAIHIINDAGDVFHTGLISI